MAPLPAKAGTADAFVEFPLLPARGCRRISSSSPFCPSYLGVGEHKQKGFLESWLLEEGGPTAISRWIQCKLCNPGIFFGPMYSHASPTCLEGGGRSSVVELFPSLAYECEKGKET